MVSSQRVSRQVGQALRRLRLERDFAMKVVASRSGVTRPMLSRGGLSLKRSSSVSQLNESTISVSRPATRPRSFPCAVGVRMSFFCASLVPTAIEAI